MAKKGKRAMGVIRRDEAYSKGEAMERLGISQRFWDQMLDAGLPYCEMGHGRWVTGTNLLEYMNENAKQKEKAKATS